MVGAQRRTASAPLQLDSRRQEGNRRYRICIALFFLQPSFRQKNVVSGVDARVVLTPETERLFALKLEDMYYLVPVAPKHSILRGTGM